MTLLSLSCFILTVILVTSNLSQAQVMKIVCENDDCLQMARRTSMAGGEDLNSIYNLMRYLRQGKVIGTNFNSPFLGKRSLVNGDKE